MQVSPSFEADFKIARTDVQTTKPQIGLLSVDNVAAMPVAGRQIRCYYWDPKTSLQTEPVPQSEALKQARTLDVNFISYNPVAIAQTLPKEAFAIQFISVPEGRSIGRRAADFTFQIFNNLASTLTSSDKKKNEPEICLIGDLIVGMNGELLLTPETGNFIAVDPSTKVLRRDDLRSLYSPYNAVEHLRPAEPA